jgi:hypothetical protein
MVKVHLPIATDSPMLRRNMSRSPADCGLSSLPQHPNTGCVPPVECGRFGEIREMK